jgi:hypothetical protein
MIILNKFLNTFKYASMCEENISVTAFSNKVKSPRTKSADALLLVSLSET